MVVVAVVNVAVTVARHLLARGPKTKPSVIIDDLTLVLLLSPTAIANVLLNEVDGTVASCALRAAVPGSAALLERLSGPDDSSP